jgi:hypothetical protein
MRENRLSGLMRGGQQTVIGPVPLNPSLPAYSTGTHLENVTIRPETRSRRAGEAERRFSKVPSDQLEPIP